MRQRKPRNTKKKSRGRGQIVTPCQKVELLRIMMEAAMSPGVYDADRYSLGHAHGLITALAIMTDTEPCYPQVEYFAEDLEDLECIGESNALH